MPAHLPSAANQPKQGGIGRWSCGIALALAMALHVFLVLRTYPFESLRHGDVPLRVDMARYFANVDSASRVNGLFGYDPFFMAGYPIGLWNSLGKKGFELIRLLFPVVPLPVLFYGTLVAVSVLSPLVLWLGLRRWFETAKARRILLAVLLLFWHLDTQIAYFWSAGNVFFPAMACLLPVAAGLLWDLTKGRRPLLSGCMLGLVVAVMFYCHTVALVALLVPAALTLCTNGAGLRQTVAWLALGIAVAVFVTLCIWWIVPLVRTIGDWVPRPCAWLQSSWKHLVMDTLSDRAYRHHFDRNFLLHSAVVLGALGVVLTWRNNRFLAVLGIGGFACLVLTYSGSYLGPLSAIQPYRFMIPAVLLLVGPMVVGLAWAWDTFSKGGQPARMVACALAVVLLPQLTGYAIDLAWERPALGLKPVQRRVVEALANMPVRGRVLCDEMNVGHVIPHFCRLPVIGGLSSQAFVRHRFAGVEDDGRIFGRRSDEWNAADFKRYLDGYAVEYAVFARGGWVGFAERNQDLFDLAQSVGGYRIYRVCNAAPSLVLEGTADVRIESGAIKVENLRTQSLVLKLHFADWLSATDGVRLEPVAFLNDPVPFIKAMAPESVRAFTIGR